MTNTDLWDRVCKTDPKHVKPITGKQYSGNSPKPYYIVRRLTEEFGPVGKAWGFDIVSERFERLTEDDVLHVAVVRFWHGNRTHSFEQMGQTKACYRTSKGALLVDEDAPKKSVTDALVKCASYLGFAGDIFMGMWDDSKYVAGLKKEFGEESDLERDLKASVAANEEQAKQKRQGVMGAVLPAVEAYLATNVRVALNKLAEKVTALHKQGAYTSAFQAVEEQGLDNEEKTYLWSLLDSGVRNKLKREKEEASMRATMFVKSTTPEAR